MRQNRCTDIHLNSTVGSKVGIVFNGFENLCQLISKENRYNCRRSLVCSKSVVVSCACNGNTKQIRIFINRFDNRHQENKELDILCRSFSRIQKVYAVICDHGPVVVLTASVDSLKWFLMKEANKIMLVSNLFHNLHGQLIVVNCNICGIEYRSKLMLCRSNLVVFCFCRNTKLPQLNIKIMHISCNLRLQGSEVMILHFLSFRSRSTK